MFRRRRVALHSRRAIYERPPGDEARIVFSGKFLDVRRGRWNDAHFAERNQRDSPAAKDESELYDRALLRGTE